MGVHKRSILERLEVDEYVVQNVKEFSAIVGRFQSAGCQFRGQTREYLMENGSPSVQCRLLRDANVVDARPRFDKALFEWARAIIPFLPSEVVLPRIYVGQTDSPVFNPKIGGLGGAGIEYAEYLGGTLAILDRPAIVTIMQHYGYPTNFFDVTTDPKVALWFATHRAIEVSPSVYTYERIGCSPETDRAQWPTVYVFSGQDVVYLRNCGLDPAVVPRPFAQAAAFIPAVIWGRGRIGVKVETRILLQMIVAVIKVNPAASIDDTLQMLDLFPLEGRDHLYKHLRDRLVPSLTIYQY